MKKNSYTILMVFLLSMLVLVGFLGWYSMEHKKVSKSIVVKTVDAQPKREIESNVLEQDVEASHSDNSPKNIQVVEKKVEHAPESKSELAPVEEDKGDEIEEGVQDIEEIMELGFSGEEAQRILDNEKEMKNNPNLIMPLEINPEIIEKMESIGYTEEEATKLLNKHMHNPDEMERIMEKLR